MPFIVGTAGHIDHGKTSLIKALTGYDTDRLKEEQERGISIDLGFAHLDLPDGTRAGVVDVPGHERFIRNMLAGAHGIDLVLFTVAADDGVMPQTEEHFDILHLLGVERAIFVITKVDLVAEPRIAEVEEEIRILTVGTKLQDSPIVPFSFVSGQGLDGLRSQIAQSLKSADRQTPPGYFRLPVDRVFVLQGHGLVVTGTARSGDITVGERVRCLPGDQVFRVRSLQVHNQPTVTGTWGQRIALNVAGPEKPSVTRGHVICHEQLTLQSQRFDASLEITASVARGVKSHQHVRVHLGTAERLGKLILLGGREHVGPKNTAFCQIALSEPLQVLRGDRFIIRDETAQRTIGGGTVLHPWARPHRRNEPGLEGRLHTLQQGEPEPIVELFLAEQDEMAVPIAPIHQFLNRRVDDVRTLVRAMTAVRVMTLEGEDLYTTVDKWNALKSGLIAGLKSFHAAHPLAPGRDMEELRDKLPGRIPARFFRAFVEQLESEGSVAREGSLLRLHDHTVTLGSDEQRVVDQITALLSANPLAPPDVPQLERETGIARARLIAVLGVMERRRAIVKVANDLYYLAGSIERVTNTLREEFAQLTITPAIFRDRFGITRKHAIPLLGFLDREGVTVRTGDARRVKAPR